MDSINVEQIMQEIRAQIKEKGLNTEVMPFEDVPFPEKRVEKLDKLEKENRKLRAESNVPYYYEMPKGIKTFIKKVIRKVVHGVVAPILDNQNQFNADVVDNLELIRQIERESYSTLIERIRELERENKRIMRILNKKDGEDG